MQSNTREEMVKAVKAVIAPTLARLAKTVREVPVGFSDEKFRESVTAWAEDLVSMLVTPEQLTVAMSSIEVTSRFFPSFQDVLKAALGDDWASRKIGFESPSIVWEEVLNLSTGQTVEVYPCAMHGTTMLTRLEVKAHGVPDPDKILAEAAVHFRTHPGVIERKARELSRYYGYDVRPGEFSLVRKPHFWGAPQVQLVESLAQPQSKRLDLQHQIAKMRGSA